MNTLLRWPRPLLATGFALLALLGACGPGVGGSGTGATVVATTSGGTVGVATVSDLPDFDLASWGASPAALCGASVAAALNCPPASASPGVGMAASSTDGTGVVYFADTATGSQVVVAMAANTIGLRRGCPAIAFTGLWGQAGGNTPRFYGSAMPGGAAALTLEADVNAQGLVITLRDRAGTLLLGPLALRPVSLPPTPPACP